MKLIHKLATLIATLVFCCAANATVLLGSAASAANTVTDFSTAGLVAFDLDLSTPTPTRLHFMLEEADLQGPLSMNAIIRNLSGVGLGRFVFSLEGISFAAAGSVTPTFGTLGTVGFSNSLAVIAFATPEFAEFHFGNPLAIGGKSDWLLSTAGMQAGDQFWITASVPEPSSVALLLPALCMLGLCRLGRRRKQ
jgi:hypothetical protein